jgi:hypothetical protein
LTALADRYRCSSKTCALSTSHSWLDELEVVAATPSMMPVASRAPTKADLIWVFFIVVPSYQSSSSWQVGMKYDSNGDLTAAMVRLQKDKKAKSIRDLIRPIWCRS